MARILCRDPLVVSGRGDTAIYPRTPARVLSLVHELDDDRVRPIDDEMVFEIEFRGGVAFAHCEFASWSPAMARRWLPSLREQFQLHGGPLFATTAQPHGGDYAKHRKFLVNLCGFRYLHDVETGPGRSQPLYLWTP